MSVPQDIQRKKNPRRRTLLKEPALTGALGRELYTAPFIWLPATKVQIQKKDGKCFCNAHFTVTSIIYNDSREITGLSIVNDKGQVVYEWKSEKDSPDSKRNELISKDQMDGLQTELQRTGVAMEAVQKRYHIDDPMRMSEELYNKVMLALSKTKSAKAA